MGHLAHVSKTVGGREYCGVQCELGHPELCLLQTAPCQVWLCAVEEEVEWGLGLSFWPPFFPLWPRIGHLGPSGLAESIPIVSEPVPIALHPQQS